MADLYHLLDELEEQQQGEETFVATADDPENEQKHDDDDDDDDDDEAQGRLHRPVTSETEASTQVSGRSTPPQQRRGLLTSEEWERPEHIEDIPIVLQEAVNEQYQQEQQDDIETSSFDDGFTKRMDKLDTSATNTESYEPNELYARMEYIWSQERHCPDLLPYDSETIQSLKLQLEEQQELVDELDAGNATDSAVAAVMATIGQIDMDRTKYVVSDWLTSRLAKIEAFPLYMREKVDNMSPREAEYLKQYGILLEHSLKESVLNHIPPAWQRLDEPNMIDHPDLDGYHFWLVKERLEAQNDDDVDHEPGTCLVANYKDMKDHLAKQKVALQL